MSQIMPAISGSNYLQPSMVLKGGILLALSYDSTRYTKDVDFSTERKLTDFDIKDFVKELDQALTQAANRLNYGLDCLVQSYKQQPPRDDATFPTIQIKIGYAYKDEPKSYQRLLRKESVTVVRIDYSLNEPVGEVDLLNIEGERDIRTYNLYDLIGEKFRALLQQDKRNRVRRQDIYDLYLILRTRPDVNHMNYKEKILQSLLTKSRIRDLEVSQYSMDDPNIISRSRQEYSSLSNEVEGDLPDFDEAYSHVNSFYKSMPW